MTIKFDDTIRAIVYCKFADKADFMCALNGTEGKVKSTGRVRFYTGDQSKGPFEDGDRKQWLESRYAVDFEEEIAKVLRTVAALAAVSRKTGHASDNDEPVVLVRKAGQGYQEFFEEFRKQPFVHSKVVTFQ